MKEGVRLYSLSTCPSCRATKKLLKKCDVRFEFTDVDLLDVEGRKAIVQELKDRNLALSFPTLFIAGKVIVGYNEKEILETLGLTEVPKSKFFKTILSKLKRRL